MRVCVIEHYFDLKVRDEEERDREIAHEVGILPR